MKRMSLINCTRQVFSFSIYCLIFITSVLHAKSYPPVARFSFNNGNSEDEISHEKPKFVNAGFTEDRFGNANNAAFTYGNLDSYINLGNYPALKPKSGSISIWVKLETVIYSGIGIKVSPIIATRNCSCSDYNEAYSIQFELDRHVFSSVVSNDSLKQIALQTLGKVSVLKWYHLVLTYDFNEVSLYLDGRLQTRFGKKFESHFEPTDSVLVGVINNENNKRALRGAVDDIAFYDHVLSPEEIHSLYKAPNPNKNKLLFNQLLVFIAVLSGIGLIFFFFKYWFNRRLAIEKRKMKLVNQELENELRINRALMNPHFMFNALNTLHKYILTNNTDKASDYLVKFSKLIRKILESNITNTISLEMEIELIERYLEIEGLRFNEKIRHHIVVEQGLTPSAITIPIMMLQPFVENSIWHGFQHKTGEKMISITLSTSENKYLVCIIEDNGTGRKIKPDKEKSSLATNFISQRLLLLNKIHNLKCSLLIEDKPNEQGTIVKITLPLLNK